MCFASVTKRRKHDHWVVEQGLRLESGNGFGCGKIVYSGSGAQEIADIVHKCSQNIYHLDPIPENSLTGSEVYKEFGYKSNNSVLTHAVTLDIWERDSGNKWYGMIKPKLNDSTLLISINVPILSNSDLARNKQVWEEIYKSIILAEKYFEI